MDHRRQSDRRGRFLMTVQQIINEANASGIVLYIKDGQLAFIAEHGSFPSDLKAKISKHKNDILIALLATEEAASEKAIAPFALLTDSERATLGDGYEDVYEDVYPMSALQTGMVFHTQLEQFSGVYHDIVAEHVKCPWDQQSFARALATCVEEHPVLRTSFRLDGERPLQLVRRAIELPLEVEDLRDHVDAEQYVKDWIEARKRHVFDWEHGPLWQLNIFLRTTESIQFVISFHHAVLDG